MGEVHVKDSIALNSIQVCIQNMQAIVISSHKGMNPEDKDVHRSYQLQQKEDNIDVWQRCTSFGAIRDMLDILGTDACSVYL